MYILMQVKHVDEYNRIEGSGTDQDTNGNFPNNKTQNIWEKRENFNKCLETYVTTWRKINFLPIFLPMQK